MTGAFKEAARSAALGRTAVSKPSSRLISRSDATGCAGGAGGADYLRVNGRAVRPNDCIVADRRDDETGIGQTFFGRSEFTQGRVKT